MNTLPVTSDVEHLVLQFFVSVVYACYVMFETLPLGLGSKRIEGGVCRIYALYQTQAWQCRLK